MKITLLAEWSYVIQVKILHLFLFTNNTSYLLLIVYILFYAEAVVFVLDGYSLMLLRKNFTIYEHTSIRPFVF